MPMSEWWCASAPAVASTGGWGRGTSESRVSEAALPAVFGAALHGEASGSFVSVNGVFRSTVRYGSTGSYTSVLRLEGVYGLGMFVLPGLPDGVKHPRHDVHGAGRLRD
jgi:hypothetical protein